MSGLCSAERLRRQSDLHPKIHLDYARNLKFGINVEQHLQFQKKLFRLTENFPNDYLTSTE